MGRFSSILGMGVLLAIAFLLSNNRRAISYRIVLAGILLQVALAFLLLAFPPIVALFDALARGVNCVIGFADEGIAFVFGRSLMDAKGPWGFVFAVKVLPVIIYFAALMAILYHMGIMQRIVAALAWILRRSMGISGSEALSVAANVFVGQTEAPLCVRPYIEKMTRSQIMTLMTGGFATIAGSVMAVYVGILGGEDPIQRTLFIKHLLTASLMSAPAAVVMAKVIFPETESPEDEHHYLVEERSTRNLLDAAATGAGDGLRLALNVAAMLIAFVALLAMLNWPLSSLSQWDWVAQWRMEHQIPIFTLQNILGWLLTPLACLMGIGWEDCPQFGSLMGQQVIATELVAYLSMADMMHSTDPDLLISPRTAQIATYALCGFANFPSIAIQIGGLTALAPHRRQDFAQLGLRAMIGGALACWMTACISGWFIVP